MIMTKRTGAVIINRDIYTICFGESEFWKKPVQNSLRIYFKYGMITKDFGRSSCAEGAMNVL